jgi:hypothetical protein
MNVKQALRTVVVPVLAGAVAAGVAIVVTRPTVKVEPDYDVPTQDDPPFHTEDSQPATPVVVTTKVTGTRKPKSV